MLAQFGDLQGSCLAKRMPEQEEAEGPATTRKTILSRSLLNALADRDSWLALLARTPFVVYALWPLWQLEQSFRCGLTVVVGAPRQQRHRRDLVIAQQGKHNQGG